MFVTDYSMQESIMSDDIIVRLSMAIQRYNESSDNSFHGLDCGYKEICAQYNIPLGLFGELPAKLYKEHTEDQLSKVFQRWVRNRLLGNKEYRENTCLGKIKYGNDFKCKGCKGEKSE